MPFTPILAQAAGGGDGSGLVQLLPLVLIFVIFWFLLIRPQQKKMKAHKAMVAAVKRGDKVVTAGGVYGTVTKVISESEVQVEIAENVRVRVVTHTLQDVVTRSEPAKGKGQPAPANDQSAKPKGFLGGLLGGGKSDK